MFNYMFSDFREHSFGVHMDKSPQICTHVEQIFLYKAGLLLNIDVAVPFLKSKNIAKNCVSIQCTPHSWPFKNNTPRLFIVFYLLGTKTAAIPQGIEKEPRPANRRGTLCPGASGPTVRRRIAGPRSTPVKTPLPVLLWGPIE